MSKNKLVVFDEGWAKSIPEWLLEEIKQERMINGIISNINPEFSQVGNAEVVAYLMTASLSMPLTYIASQVYVFLAAQLMERQGKPLDDFMKSKLKAGLTNEEKAELKELRQDIYRARGGDIDHPMLNALKNFRKKCCREAERESITRQPRLL